MNKTRQKHEGHVTFEEMGLDIRLLKAIFNNGWTKPTLIQEQSIMLGIEGKDILLKGRTGTGKSAAVLIPIMHNLLLLKKLENLQETRCVILAPSKELAKQLLKHANELNLYSSKYVRIVDICQHGNLKPILVEKPDIIIGTPLTLLKQIKVGNLSTLKETLKYLVIDEADLMFSFGYESDLKAALDKILPENGSQSFLISATLNPDVGVLKNLILRNAVIVKLQESDLPESDKLTQYHIQVEEEDKFVLINALFKLNLIRGRTIIFVNNIDRCYKLRLFLEQFGIRSCILNSELPVESRCSVVDQFNRGIYDIIIASDEKCAQDARQTRKSNRKRDPEYGVSRGIDFQNVSSVINFDFPLTVTAYIHRVGRTARGHENAEGTALSFISMKEKNKFEQLKESLSDESNFKSYQFKMEELDAFRYRTQDAHRAITSIAVREARIKEIKREIMSSNKLKSFFEEHPKDYKILRHDRALHTVKLQHHLKDVPEYIVPPTLKSMVANQRLKKKRMAVDDDNDDIYVKTSMKNRRKRKNNPLKTFKSFESRKKGKKKKSS